MVLLATGLNVRQAWRCRLPCPAISRHLLTGIGILRARNAETRSPVDCDIPSVCRFRISRRRGGHFGRQPSDSRPHDGRSAGGRVRSSGPGQVLWLGHRLAALNVFRGLGGLAGVNLGNERKGDSESPRCREQRGHDADSMVEAVLAESSGDVRKNEAVCAVVLELIAVHFMWHSKQSRPKLPRARNEQLDERECFFPLPFFCLSLVL